MDIPSRFVILALRSGLAIDASGLLFPSRQQIPSASGLHAIPQLYYSASKREIHFPA
jgi:hypothetical protein